MLSMLCYCAPSVRSSTREYMNASVHVDRFFFLSWLPAALNIAILYYIILYYNITILYRSLKYVAGKYGLRYMPRHVVTRHHAAMYAIIVR